MRVLDSLFAIAKEYVFFGQFFYEFCNEFYEIWSIADFSSIYFHVTRKAY